ncbi:glycosyltransferase family 2 protein [Nonlabens marinus]|uniref:Colanic acid biosynthesis glycosyl transferase WcaE n=1 Tax=Nonlabens marinus S1-08 TaxID=1454201 RepID=W8W0Q4_9FLAO|nr:glycosyltransferase family 2 protein [Nonlabens marinus]BAO56731.1 colanic acid biosynthesis glycosyl transferase WcaE [Nonlabens marinus S1-08]
MKISIITVCYNSSATVRETFESVKAQVYDDIEYIVIDGASNDGTQQIIEEYDHIITKWVSESDNGLYHAMNKGIQLSTGDVIAILNSDDIFRDKHTISIVAETFAENPTADSIFADIYYVSQNNTDKIVRNWKSGKQKPFSNGWHPAHPTFYVKSSFYSRYGLFNLDLKLAADFEIMLRFLERENLSTVYLNQPLVKMRLGGATNQSLSNIYHQNLECLKAFEINDIRVNKLLYLFYRLLPKLRQFFFDKKSLNE